MEEQKFTEQAKMNQGKWNCQNMKLVEINWGEEKMERQLNGG